MSVNSANQELLIKQKIEKNLKCYEKNRFKLPKVKMAHSLEEAIQIQPSIGFPIIIRPSLRLGSRRDSINQDEFEEIVNRGLDASPTHEVLIEQSVLVERV